MSIPNEWFHPGLYIDGAFADAQSGKRFKVTNPADGAELGTVPDAGSADAQRAVAAAAAAFPAWAARPARERAALLMNLCQSILAHKEDLALLLTLEQGKPLTEARGEIQIGADYVRWYAEEAHRIYGEMMPHNTADRRILVIKQPMGVVGAITPWNFPFSMITRKAAPALAAGCTVVLKPAEQTPLIALALAALAQEAGLPAGTFNIVTAANPAPIGDTFFTDARVRKVSFTGSTAVGKMLMRAAAGQVKKLSLELGGHAPFIVFADADLDRAVEGAIACKFRNAGQTCICTNRVLVEESVAAPFAERLAARVRQLKVGPGTEAGVEVGPLIDEAGCLKAEEHVQDAITRGGRALTGGHRLGTGLFFEPTLLMDVSPDMKVMREETFGPVLPIMTFRDEAEALRIANDTPYGLAAYAYTTNLGRAVRVYEGLEYGIVGINDPVPTVVQAPFGGVKESGMGREGGKWGLEEYLEMKYVSLGI